MDARMAIGVLASTSSANLTGDLAGLSLRCYAYVIGRTQVSVFEGFHITCCRGQRPGLGLIPKGFLRPLQTGIGQGPSEFPARNFKAAYAQVVAELR